MICSRSVTVSKAPVSNSLCESFSEELVSPAAYTCLTLQYSPQVSPKAAYTYWILACQPVNWKMLPPIIASVKSSSSPVENVCFLCCCLIQSLTASVSSFSFLLDILCLCLQQLGTAASSIAFFCYVCSILYSFLLQLQYPLLFLLC